MQGLRADVARLALRVVGAFLDRDRDGLRVLLICVVLLGAASFLYQFAELVVPALFPVLQRVLQRPHFLPEVSPSSVAQTAHCVRIISCGQLRALRGLLSLSALLPLAC